MPLQHPGKMKRLAHPAVLLPLVLLGLLLGISDGFIRVGSTLITWGAEGHGLYMVDGNCKWFWHTAYVSCYGQPCIS